ncbi:Bug family tripartite tricarboxylate transporter substrate binding protein [Telluria beijingensis]|uniref:Bug family tripartite tricarboxylate transporter substrate binding protein n=1 Tax=Telluria beijingensis TaxID=3068633 RepID=UPI0027958181|nr:tripartite tricarboxylate transporter substrate binding protein [Massilia sp. REN29]
MTIFHSRIALPALLAGASLLAAGAAQAAGNDAWPSKTVRLVVPYVPGGTSDTLGRVLATHLTESMKQTFIVENRGGAGGITGSAAVAKMAPDGYTLVISGVGSHAIAPSLPIKVPYDPMRNFTHIAVLGGPPNVLAVHPSVPAKDLKGFLAYARSQDGKLNYGSPGNGTQGHLFAENFMQITGIHMAHVPYKGANPAVSDLMAGHIQTLSTTLSTAAGQIRGGKARALAVSSEKRIADFPDVPTFAELGHPELVATTWFSLSGPAGLDPAIVQRLNTEVRRILKLPDVRKRLLAEGIEPNDLDPQQSTAYIASEIKRWAPVVKATGASVN